MTVHERVRFFPMPSVSPGNHMTFHEKRPGKIPGEKVAWGT